MRHGLTKPSKPHSGTILKRKGIRQVQEYGAAQDTLPQLNTKVESRQRTWDIAHQRTDPHAKDNLEHTCTRSGEHPKRRLAPTV